MKLLYKIDPKLKNVLDGYITNFLRSNYWRVENIMEWDDAFQEAYFTILIMEKRLFKHGKDVTIETPQQYMACFKTCWQRHFHTLSNRDTKYKSVKTESSFNNIDDEELLFSVSNLLTDDNVGYMELVLEQAPSEVKAVFNLLLNAPKEVLESVSLALKKDITSNIVLCRLLGYDSKQVNIVETTKKYLSNF